eukprot:6941832-Heterocapsa_arctica.AAC.1
MESNTTTGLPEGRSNHRLSAVSAEAWKPMETNSMNMLDAEKKRGGTDLFESPDAMLAVELSEDIPSTMHKPPRANSGGGGHPR